MIWSVTPFFNEVEMLEARLAEMASVADRFLIIEGHQTFRGEPKPPYFDLSVYPKWEDKIYYRIVDLPNTKNPWDNEHYQRNVAKDILLQLGVGTNDLVLLTDVDEIVKAERIGAIRKATQKGPVALAMTQYWFNFNWVEPREWIHPKAFRFGQVGRLTFDDMRNNRDLPVIPDAGWHFSWFGDIDRKLRSFSHTEFDTPEFHDPDTWQVMKERGRDIHDRLLVAPNEVLPYHVTKALSPLL